MFDTASNLGLFPIGSFLFFGQRIPTLSLFTDMGSDTLRELRGEMSLGAVSVSIDVLTGDEAQEHITVVNRGRRHLVIGDDFALSIDLCVVFVAVMKFLVLDSPSGIDILLCQLVLGLHGVRQPFFRGFTILDGLIVLARVPLVGSIHDGSFVGDDSLHFGHTVKLCKQVFDAIGLVQGIPEQPDSLCVWHFVPKTEKSLKTHP